VIFILSSPVTRPSAFAAFPNADRLASPWNRQRMPLVGVGVEGGHNAHPGGAGVGNSGHEPGGEDGLDE